LKRLLLLGSGRAHLQVLHDFAAEALPGVEVTLAAPSARFLHAGMLPGFVAGHYTLAQCGVALAPIAERAGARLLQAAVAGLDLAGRGVTLADGRALPYDALSLDTEAATDRDAIPGAREHGLFLRPAEAFVSLWESMRELAERQPMCVVVVGGGVAGVEMALALHHRLGDRSRVSLVTGGGPVLPSHSGTMRQRVLRALKRRNVTLLEDACAEVSAGHLMLGGGTRVACDAAVMALAPCAPPWLRDAGLALDESGFVATGPTLQSRSHPEVFSAGDAPPRAGAALALNLRRFLAGGQLQPWTAPPRSLQLLACGEQHAIAGWGAWSAEGRWAWRWKDRIDRGLLAAHTGQA
jgi:NADH dehydrogenase FAD-containing subunit